MAFPLVEAANDSKAEAISALSGALRAWEIGWPSLFTTWGPVNAPFPFGPAASIFCWRTNSRFARRAKRHALNLTGSERREPNLPPSDWPAFAKEKLVASRAPVAAIAVSRIAAPTVFSPATSARAIRTPISPPALKLASKNG